MADNFKAIDEIIYPELEPGVINNELIKEAIEAEGYKGEAGRLQRLKPIDYSAVKELRLEFKNILRIDHLWVLPNLTRLSLNFNKLDRIENIDMLIALKELDLSFNYIKKIENLDSLTNLETLTLFNNQISKLENLDSLENLIILSVGNNLIESYDGIERFRFMRKLRCLNLEGNPIAKYPHGSLRIYIAGILPNLWYYNYVYITEDERKSGKTKYQREIRDVEDAERSEIDFREKNANELADEKRLSASFVEHLNEHQLFESLFYDDIEGRALQLIGEKADELIKEYKIDVFAITQKMYKLGLLQYDKRTKEVAIFQKQIADAQQKAQKHGQCLIEEFLQYKETVFNNVAEIIEKIESKDFEDNSSEINNSVEKIEQKLNEFNFKLEDLWQILMEAEVQLFESIEDTTTTFSHIIQEMVTKFIEEALTYFVQLRDRAFNFSEEIFEAVCRYISYMTALGTVDKIPLELKDCISDQDAIIALVTGMRENHTAKIDEREDKLVTRGNDWTADLIDQIKKDEVTRNRNKVVEINYFIDQMKESFEQLQKESLEDFCEGL